MTSLDVVRRVGASPMAMMAAIVLVSSFSRPAEARLFEGDTLPFQSGEEHGNASAAAAPGAVGGVSPSGQSPLLPAGVPIERQVASSWFIVWLAARYYPGFCEDLPTHLLEMCGEEKRKAELERRRSSADKN